MPDFTELGAVLSEFFDGTAPSPSHLVETVTHCESFCRIALRNVRRSVGSIDTAGVSRCPQPVQRLDDGRRRGFALYRLQILAQLNQLNGFGAKRLTQRVHIQSSVGSSRRSLDFGVEIDDLNAFRCC